MSVIKLNDAVVALGGTYASGYDGTALPHVTGVTIEYNADMLEDTEMGRTTHTNISGLFNWSITVEMNQDWGAASTDAVIFPLIGSATGTVIKVKPTSAAVGATNPVYYGTVIASGYSPISAKVGDLPKVSVKFVPFGASSALVRSTS